MSIAINILSAVLKSLVNNKIGNELANELIGISIDEVSEKGINRINDFINGEKSKISRILSKENMKSMNISEQNVDYVVAEIKDLLSKVKITDEVFRQCKYESMELSVYLLEEYRAYKDGYLECESDIKKVLFTVADALIKLMRDSEGFEKDFLIQISNSVDDTNAQIQKISNYIQENFYKLNVNNQEILVILHSILKQTQSSNMQNKKQTVKSRTQDYADKWNANMFLNDFDKRDKHAGVNIKLKDVYLESHLPHYIWKDNPEDDPSTDLKDLLIEYIDKKIDNKMLLILGHPGIGKSTLITWIAANFINSIENILTYKFASDLKSINWYNKNEKYSIVDDILDTLNLSYPYNQLNGKTLILDGFDEISIRSDRAEILNQLYWKLVKESMLQNFSLIITCRENYIHDLYRVECDYITIKPWNFRQIKSFCDIYGIKSKCNISIPRHGGKFVQYKEVLGIPLILYMALALNISIEKEGSIVDVYSKIFSLDGGIYERCIDNRSFADKHRIVEVKKQIHQISRDIAIWMFENKPNEAFIPQTEYERICNVVMKEGEQENKDIKQDFKIGNYFKLVKHCEGVETEELYFVHRSIYEYFVAETIYSYIKDALLELSEESKQLLAGNIAMYLKEGRITNTIGDYLQYMILKLYQSLNDEKKEIFYQWWESTVDMMMISGMFYYTKQNIQNYKDIIKKEGRCFLNLLEILRRLLPITNKKYIMESVNLHKVSDYIGLAQWGDYSKLFLKGADLRGKSLHELNLAETCLCGADLRRTDLVGANLYNADLQEADLRGAELRSTHLEKTSFKGAKLDESQIATIKDHACYLQDVRIYIEKEQRFISYQEYCKRKNK